MPSPRWLALLCLSLPACGPEAGLVPRTGIYDVTSELVANDCRFDVIDSSSLDVVQFRDDRLIVGFADFPLTVSEAGAGPSARPYIPLVRGPDGDRFGTDPSSFFEWFEWDGCRMRRGLVADLLGDDVIQSHVTFTIEDVSACGWLHDGQDRCEYVHENTFTLREACDGCDHATMSERIRELWAEEHPLPK